MTKPFALGREVTADGRFVRQGSAFRRWVTADGSSGFPAAAGRYHLYVCLACPWSHRTVIVRHLKGLEDAVSMSFLDPYRDERGWAFSGGEFVDPVNGFAFLREAYAATDPSFGGRVTVPVLWDKETRQVVSNESADLLRMFNGEFEAFARHHVDLYPEALRAEIDAVEAFVYDNVNDGVYKAGFARSQRAYDEAYERLFAALDQLEERLASSRYLVGDSPTEADWRLFPTLVRFDAVYYVHFKCNRRRLVDYPNLWGYARDLYQRPGIAQTVAMDQIKRHYYTTHGFLNPSGIIPRGPEIDFEAPYDRARLSPVA
ncbi:MAG TPA: glutathione S-transferase family protein [Thermoleophilia bacterium]|nr:glutathione S-transferase family protein [Thermoleophilia bacterium]